MRRCPSSRRIESFEHIKYNQQWQGEQSLKHVNAEEEVDVALVGAGIMSTTLGVFLKELQSIGHINGLSRVDILADCADRTCRPVQVSIY
jgi:hypothetical protein